jgi:hypothetical protein
LFTGANHTELLGDLGGTAWAMAGLAPEDMIRLIPAKKNEPELMLEWRRKAYQPAAHHARARVAQDPLDFIEADLVVAAVVKARGAGALVVRICCATRACRRCANTP